MAEVEKKVAAKSPPKSKSVAQKAPPKKKVEKKYPKEVAETFVKRPDIEAVYICTNGERKGEYFFNLPKAIEYFPGAFDKIENPHFK